MQWKYSGVVFAFVLTAVNAVDDGKGNVYSQVGLGVVDSIDGQCHIRHNRHSIFTTVNKMGEDVPSVLVSAKTLQQSPDWRKGGEKSKGSRILRIALNRVLPVVSIETEEELNVLHQVSRRKV